MASETQEKSPGDAGSKPEGYTRRQVFTDLLPKSLIGLGLFGGLRELGKSVRPVADLAGEAAAWYKAQREDTEAMVDRLSVQFQALLESPPQVVEAKTGIDPERAELIGLPYALSDILSSEKFLMPDREKALRMVDEAFQKQESAGTFASSSGISKRAQANEGRVERHREGDVVLLSRQADLMRTAPLTYSGEVLSKEMMRHFPSLTLSAPSLSDRRSYNPVMNLGEKGKIHSWADNLFLGFPESPEEVLLFGNGAYGIRFISGDLVCGPGFCVDTHVYPYTGGEESGVSIRPHTAVLNREGVTMHSQDYESSYDLPAHLAGKDVVVMIKSEGKGILSVDFLLGREDPSWKHNEYMRQSIREILTKTFLPPRIWEELYREVGLDYTSDDLIPSGFAVLGIEGKYKLKKADLPDYQPDNLQRDRIKKTFVFELTPSRYGGSLGVLAQSNPYERRIAVMTQELVTGFEPVKVMVLPARQDESLHMIGKVEDKIICARIRHKKEKEIYDPGEKVPADLVGLSVIGENGIEKEIDLPQKYRFSGDIDRSPYFPFPFFRSANFLPVVDNHSHSFTLYALEAGEPDSKGIVGQPTTEYNGRELLRLPLREIISKDNAVPTWNYPVLDIEIEGMKEDGDKQSKKEAPLSFPVELVGGAEAKKRLKPPLFEGIDDDTVLIYIPGAGGDRAAGEADWFAPPWFKAFLKARGLSTEEAEKEFGEYLRWLHDYDKIDHLRSRLQLQLQKMVKTGLVILPWELVTGSQKNPCQMAVATAAFIKSLPPGKKVILMGHSLGGTTVRSFLSMYQEGILDKSLKDKQIMGSVSISEGYPGDLLNAAIYHFVGKKGWKEVGEREAEEIYEWVIRTLRTINSLGEGEIKGIIEWLVKEVETEPKGEQAEEKWPFGLEDKRRQLSLLIKSIKSQSRDALPVLEGKKGLATEYIKRAGNSLAIPGLISGVDGRELKKKGCTVVTVRSPEDLLAVNALIPSGVDVQVALDSKKDFALSAVKLEVTPDNRPLIAFPPLEKLGETAESIGGPAHSSHEDVASLVFGKKAEFISH